MDVEAKGAIHPNNCGIFAVCPQHRYRTTTIRIKRTFSILRVLRYLFITFAYTKLHPYQYIYKEYRKRYRSTRTYRNTMISKDNYVRELTNTHFQSTRTYRKIITNIMAFLLGSWASWPQQYYQERAKTL